MKTRNFDYVGSNVEAVGNIAKVCKEVGVPKFIHVSAVAANEETASEWLRCKAMGEAQVRMFIVYSWFLLLCRYHCHYLVSCIPCIAIIIMII